MSGSGHGSPCEVIGTRVFGPDRDGRGQAHLASSDGSGRDQAGSLFEVRNDVVELPGSHEPSQRSLSNGEVLGTADEVDVWLVARTVFVPRRHERKVGPGIGPAPAGDPGDITCCGTRLEVARRRLTGQAAGMCQRLVENEEGLDGAGQVAYQVSPARPCSP